MGADMSQPRLLAVTVSTCARSVSICTVTYLVYHQGGQWRDYERQIPVVQQ